MLTYRNTILQTPGLVSYWPFDDASGNALDVLGLNNALPKNEAGITRAQASLLPSGEGKSCKLVAASSGYFELPDTASLDTGDVFALELWIKPENTGTAREIYSGPASASLFGLLATNKIRMSKQGVSVITESTSSIEPATVYHVCFSKNGTSLSRKMYVNGISVTNNLTNAVIETPAGPYFIGSNGVATNTFSGYIQNLALYKTELSQAEVEYHYVVGTQPFVPAPFVKDGFLRSKKGALITTAAGTDTWQTGFLRNKANFKLVVTESTVGAKWVNGFLRSATGILIVKEAGAEGVVWKSGYLRDKNGALVVTKSEAETPIAWRSGFLRNKSGRLIIE